MNAQKLYSSPHPLGDLVVGSQHFGNHTYRCMEWHREPPKKENPTTLHCSLDRRVYHVYLIGRPPVRPHGRQIDHNPLVLDLPRNSYGMFNNNTSTRVNK